MMADRGPPQLVQELRKSLSTTVEDRVLRDRRSAERTKRQRTQPQRGRELECDIDHKSNISQPRR